jgi:DNA-binding beta-propeller fold protein YncE
LGEAWGDLPEGRLWPAFDFVNDSSPAAFRWALKADYVRPPNHAIKRGHAVKLGVYLGLLLAVLLCSNVCATAQSRLEVRRPVPHPLSYDVALPSAPYGIAPSADGGLVFVGLATGVAIIKQSNSGYTLARVVALPRSAYGIALTHDGQLLAVAAQDGSVTGIYFIDVSGLAARGADAAAVVGFLSEGAHAGAVNLSITADDRWLFVCDESFGQLTIVDLNRVRSGDLGANAIVGTIRLHGAPTATVFSPDGVWAYTTIEMVDSFLGWPKACILEGQNVSQTLVYPQGAVVVINVALATGSPALAAPAAGQFVPAGCSPVRLARSPEGNTLYVTARNSNMVLALDTAKFAFDPMHALTGSALVGVAPVPVAVIDNGAAVVVGNSNRFFEAFVPQSLNVLDAAKLRANMGSDALIRIVPAGAFPREMRLSRDGTTLFLTNYDSNSLQIIDATELFTRERRRVALGQ